MVPIMCFAARAIIALLHNDAVTYSRFCMVKLGDGVHHDHHQTESRWGLLVANVGV